MFISANHKVQNFFYNWQFTGGQSDSCLQQCIRIEIGIKRRTVANRNENS